MSIIRDPSLAEAGMKKIEWVRSHMPALSQIEKQFEKEQPFKGLRIAVSVHLEAKTANLGLVLKKGGAEVFLTGCNPLSTQDDVAAAVASLGVCGWTTDDRGGDARSAGYRVQFVPGRVPHRRPYNHEYSNAFIEAAL